MEIENKKGILEIENITALEIERTNPLFNEQGSYSLPLSIKRTPHNDYILGFPASTERKDQFEDKQAVNVRAGILNENGTFEIFDTTDSVEGTIYLFESTFYNRSKEVKLSTVFEGVERWFQEDTVSREERIEYMIDVLQTMLTSYPDDSEEFTIFPAVIECEPEAQSILTPSFKATQALNEVDRVDENGKTFYRLKARNVITKKDDNGDTLTLPKGYAVTPFLKFNYILRKIFEYFDLTLEESIFDTDPSCKRICVLNNTMDALWPGYFIESQLVPDCTVSEFLDVIRESMCGDFKINPANKTAKLILFNDVLDSEPDLDLTPYLIKPFEKYTHAKSKQVKLTLNRSQAFADVSIDTYDEFLKKYPEYNLIQPSFLKEGTFPFYRQNSIWKLYDPLPGWVFSTYKTERLSSMNFDYLTSDKIDTEEHKIPMEALATVHFSNNELDYFFAPVIDSRRNLNSYVMLDGKKQKEETPKCPVMLSCETWEVPTRLGLQHENSPFSLYPNSLLLWTDNGFFQRFWKRYDEILRNSFNENTYKLRLPAHIIQSFSFEKLKVVNGQLLFPVSMKYKMEDKDFIEVEMLLKTVKKYDGKTRGVGSGKNDDNTFPDTGEENSETPGENNTESNLELADLIGTWVLTEDSIGTASPKFMDAKFQLNADNSGTIYMKNENKTINTTFSSLQLELYDISRVLTLNTPEGKVVISILLALDPNNITLSWGSEVAIGKMKKI